MTTLARVDETLVRFDRKSPRESYRQICEELGVHMQRDIYALLPDASCAWHRIQSLDLDRSLLGVKGCMTILPIVTVSTTLRKISLRSCGLTDEFTVELCSILQSHPAVRAVDISQNDLVTVYSAPHIINLMKGNSNMVNFEVSGTHVGTNVGNIIAELGMQNLTKVLSYYEDNYFKMKNLFNYLDADGSGWVSLKSLVLNCPYPVLQEQFVERIAMKKPRKRSDNTISINVFMQLVYMNYKTETEIQRWAEQELDETYIFTLTNWKQMMAGVERYNSRDDVSVEVRLSDDLHRWRVRDYVIPDESIDAIISVAIQIAQELTSAAEEDATPDAEEETRSAKSVVTLGAVSLIKGTRSAGQPPLCVTDKPVYRFFQDHDAAYVPDILRNGSRIFSMGHLSFSSAGGSTAWGSDTNSEVAEGPNDPARTFQLPPSVVRMMVQFFEEEYEKVPKKKQSVVPDSPRTKRDKAMVKPHIPVPVFLSSEFKTDFEVIRPRLLADYYIRNALLIEDGTITMEELINVMDEMYVQCRIERIFSLHDIEEMENPMQSEKYKLFVEQHMKECNGDVEMIDPAHDDLDLLFR